MPGECGLSGESGQCQVKAAYRRECRVNVAFQGKVGAMSDECGSYPEMLGQMNVAFWGNFGAIPGECGLLGHCPGNVANSALPGSGMSGQCKVNVDYPENVEQCQVDVANSVMSGRCHVNVRRNECRGNAICVIQGT